MKLEIPRKGTQVPSGFVGIERPASIGEASPAYKKRHR